MTGPGWYRLRPDGLELHVRLTPKSSSDSVDGIGFVADGSSHIAARVRAVPEKGAANVALERLLASRFRLPKSTVSVVSGATSRLKTVRIQGAAADLARIIEEALAPAGKQS